MEVKVIEKELVNVTVEVKVRVNEQRNNQKPSKKPIDNLMEMLGMQSPNNADDHDHKGHDEYDPWAQGRSDADDHTHKIGTMTV